MAVLKWGWEQVYSGDGDRMIRLSGMHGQPWLRGSREWTNAIIKDVVERGTKPFQCFRGPVNRQRFPLGKNAEIVDAVDVIGVLVGIQHGIDSGDSRADQLEPKLGWRVDEYGGAVGLQHGPRAGALVSGVSRAAHRTPTPDLRHAKRRAGTEKRETHLLNCFDLEEVGSAGHVEGNAGCDHEALAWLGQLPVEDLLPGDRQHGVIIVGVLGQRGGHTPDHGKLAKGLGLRRAREDGNGGTAGCYLSGGKATTGETNDE